MQVPVKLICICTRHLVPYSFSFYELSGSVIRKEQPRTSFKRNQFAERREISSFFYSNYKVRGTMLGLMSSDVSDGSGQNGCLLSQ